MTGRLLIILFISTTAISSSAQFDFDPEKFINALVGPLESDRPGQAINPNTAGVMALQLQTGFNYGSRRNDFFNYRAYHVPVDLRFGITKKWELNTSFDYLNQHAKYVSFISDITTAGFLSPEIGMRYAFLSGSRWKPFLALQANMSFLSHNGDYQQQQMGSSFYLVSSNRFKSFSVNTNFGIVLPGDGDFNLTFPWVVNFGWSLGEKFSAFVEGFGEFNNKSLNWDAGFSYLVINDLQLDLFGGMYNIIDHQDFWFAEFGITYRFSFFKMIARKKAQEMMKEYNQ